LPSRLPTPNSRKWTGRVCLKPLTAKSHSRKQFEKHSPKRCAAIRAVYILGEDVAEAGTPFKVLSGLVEEFGRDRVVDTPISEAGFTGLAVGAAMTGLRPVVDIMFGDFITLTMDQMANQAAKSITCRVENGSPHGDADHTRSSAALRGATLTIPARVVQPRPGTESGAALNAYDAKGS